MLISDFLALTMMLFVLLMLATAMVSLFIRVPYVPTRMRVARRIIEVAKLKKGEIVYDLGCGDGRLLLEAEKKTKIDARGYEMAPIPYLLAKLKKWFHGSEMHIYMKNFFHGSLKDADVIFCYLGPETMDRLSKKFRHECKKGTRIISHTFHLNGFRPKKIWHKDAKNRLPTIYVYEK